MSLARVQLRHQCTNLPPVARGVTLPLGLAVKTQSQIINIMQTTSPQRLAPASEVIPPPSSVDIDHASIISEPQN